ncbi:MAG: CehA/McbA family metallohydrolase [Planctomycetota bacterium]
MHRLLLPSLCAGALGVGLLTYADAGSEPLQLGPSTVEILPFGLMSEVRRADLTVPMQVQLYNSGDASVRLLELEVRTPEGETLSRVDLDEIPLQGDHGLVNEIYLDMERADPDFSHRHTNRLFIPLEDWVPLGPEAEAETIRRAMDGVAELKRSGAPQLHNALFDVDLERLFGTDAQVGDVAPFEVVVRWHAGSGGIQQSRYTQHITMIPAFRPPPVGHWSNSQRGTSSWVVGDLHVHNCRDEAIGGCDSCAAESLNITGAFTNADLKTQFQAIGFDYFSSTTHSYCINSDTEFQAVLTEAQTLSDPSFVMLASTEISGVEQGPQSGSDSANLLFCLFGDFNVHHMGAHHVTTRKDGGQDGLLEFCDAPMQTQGVNASEVNAEGGFTIANHPASTFWAYNSSEWMAGQEANSVWGVEVWNGSENTNVFQDYQRDWWLDRLNEGKILYPYSGSDTHDTAYNFGATFTLLNGPLDSDNLNAALKSGNNYLSNGPFLEATLSDGGSRSLRMGGRVSVPGARIPPGFQVFVDVNYNVDTTGSTVKVYRGVVGSGETLISTTSGLTGAGSFQVQDTLPTSTCWYRAEVQNVGFTESALTTPVFIGVR